MFVILAASEILPPYILLGTEHTWPPLPCLMRGLGAAGGGIGIAGSAAGLARPLKLEVFCLRKPASLQDA